MGSDAAEDEKPLHPLRVADFELDVHEVTVESYGRCVEAKASVPSGTIHAP